MGISERKQKEKETLRREILDAARKIFVTEGYDRLSMRKLAEKIEYSPTTIYLYFNDKAELLREVCEEAFRQLGDEISKRQADSSDPISVLRNGMIAYIDFGLSHPHHYEVIFISPNERYFKGKDYKFEGSMGERAFELLTKSVANCLAAGVIREGEVALISQTLWAGIHGITSLLITHQGFPFVEKRKLIDSVVDTMIDGLRK